MINKQKFWFLTLFSLILVLSIYYITMPSEVLVTSKNVTDTTNSESVNVSEADIITVLQIELDEQRSALVAEYNETLTSKDASTEEKNSAYEGLKGISELKAKEEELEKLVKNKLKLESFIKINSENISITIKEKKHDYSLANDVMRLVQEQFNEKKYISVKFQN